MDRLYVSARGKDTHSGWKRVGIHQKSGKFYWFSSDYAKQLRHRHQLAGSIPSDAKTQDRLRTWANNKNLSLNIDHVSLADTFATLCEQEVGTHEEPIGSNAGPRVDWYKRATTYWSWDKGGWPWCCAFVVRMALEAGYPLPPKMRTASVDQFFDEAARLGLTGGKIKRGSAVELLGTGAHTGVATAPLQSKATHLPTVEGNTSKGTVGSQANGAWVAERERPRSRVFRHANLDGLL